MFAKWTANAYTVTFDAGLGAVDPATKPVTYGAVYGGLPVPTRKGYVFAGWWTGAGGTGTQVTEMSIVLDASDHSLNAKWTATPYMVLFDGPGSNWIPVLWPVFYGAAYGTLPIPTLAGHTFLGWWTGPDGEGEEVTAHSIVATDSDHTLYTNWLADKFRLDYVAGPNGTISGICEQTVSYGESGTSVMAVPDQGFRFICWSDGRTDNPRQDEFVTRGNVHVTALFGGVAFEEDCVEISEIVGSVTLSVSGGVSGLTSSVAYWVLPGTAAAGTDYTPPKTQPQRLAWTNEAGTRTIMIPIKTDALLEDDETFYVLLGDPVNCTLGEPKVCKVVITDANSGLTLADALDNALLKWTTGGAAAWLPQTAATWDGEDAAASGAMPAGGASSVQTSVPGTGTLSFAWSVSGPGVLRLYDGKLLLAAVTNATDWQTRTFELKQNAAHALKWEFVQSDEPASRAYLDRVVWLTGGQAGVAVTAAANDPKGGTVSGSGVHQAGAKVPLKAVARPGWLFTGWTPAGLFAKPLAAAQLLTLGESDVAVTAHFAKIPVVTGLPNPPEGGTVAGSGLCPPGKSVTLKAAPAKGWAFTSWSDGPQLAARAVSATTDVTLFAGFKPVAEIAPPAVADPGPRQAMVGVPFSLRLGVASESLPVVTVTGLPAGLTFSAATLTVTGVPTAAPAGGVAIVKAASSNAGGKGAEVTFALAVAPLDPRAQGTFTAVASDSGGGTVRGLLSATVSAQGAVSAKVSAQAGVASFAGKSWDSASGGVFRATLRTAKGEALTLEQDAGAAWDALGLGGALAGGAFSNAALAVSGQRNPAAAKTAVADHAAATNALARYTGYYTVALPPEALLEGPGTAGNVPLGNGWLALTVKDGGTVTLAGRLADGTALSGASTLLVAGADGAAYVPFLFPLYGAKGGFSGVLEILPGEAAPGGNVVAGSGDFLQAWTYPGKAPAARPSLTEDRFALALGASGGWYGPLTDLRAYYSNAVFAADGCAVSNAYVSGGYTATVGVVAEALPQEALRFDPKSGAVSLPAGRAPVYDGAADAYVYAPTNAAAATLTAVRATGLFSGAFNLYYEYRDQKGALQLRTVPVPHAGVLTPVRADPGAEPPGRGFYLVPDTWRSPDAKPVAYPLKRSYGVEVRDGE